MIELRNKEVKNIKTELMPFKKFCESKRILYRDETKLIEGTFRDSVTKELVKKDIFTAYVVGNGTAKDTYEAYLLWFNHTRTQYENAREFVEAKFILIK